MGSSRFLLNLLDIYVNPKREEEREALLS